MKPNARIVTDLVLMSAYVRAAQQREQALEAKARISLVASVLVLAVLMGGIIAVVLWWL